MAHKHQRLWVPAVALTALLSQYSVLLMSIEEKERGKAHWNDLEVRELVDYYHQNRSEVGETGNFREKTYNAAAEHIAQYLSHGPTKTGKMCKTKWISIKQLYVTIEIYRNQSGVHWDNDHGAGIEGDVAATVWSTYVQQKGKSILRPYRNHGWEHYNKVQDILPTSRVQGSRVFTPANNPPPFIIADEDESGGGSATDVDSAVASNPDIVMHPSDTPPRSSISAGKHKYSTFSQDDAIFFPAPTSSKSSTSFSARHQSSTSKSSARMSSARSSSRVTSAVALNGVQGSINRLTDVVERTIAMPDGPSTHRKAVTHLQDMEDNLSTTDMVKLISQFERSEVLAGTYLSLRNQTLRRAWIHHRLTMPESNGAST